MISSYDTYDTYVIFKCYRGLLDNILYKSPYLGLFCYYDSCPFGFTRNFATIQDNGCTFADLCMLLIHEALHDCRINSDGSKIISLTPITTSFALDIGEDMNPNG